MLARRRDGAVKQNQTYFAGQFTVKFLFELCHELLFFADTVHEVPVVVLTVLLRKSSDQVNDLVEGNIWP